jgi:two-component system nitrogen regulation response regulator GlnG
VVLAADLPTEVKSGEAPASNAGSGQASLATPGEPADLSAVARTLFGWARKDGKLKVIPAVERELIINALAETGGNQVQAAKLLGITRATLRKRIDKFQIKQELSIH